MAVLNACKILAERLEEFKKTLGDQAKGLEWKQVFIILLAFFEPFLSLLLALTVLAKTCVLMVTTKHPACTSISVSEWVNHLPILCMELLVQK